MEPEISLELNLGKKKKKSKNTRDCFHEESVPETTPCNDQEYNYMFLLQRAMRHISADNPSLCSEPVKTRLKPLDVQREGTRKTVVTNFGTLCNDINRDRNHVMSFFLCELNSDCSIDANDRLILKGRYSPGAVSSIARKYIEQYVMCNGCKSFDTIIDRDKATRLFFLRCSNCHASQSVSPIQQGFRAKI
jgi:translation initiation factor 2 subunit 2